MNRFNLLKNKKTEQKDDNQQTTTTDWKPVKTLITQKQQQISIHLKHNLRHLYKSKTVTKVSLCFILSNTIQYNTKSIYMRHFQKAQSA